MLVGPTGGGKTTARRILEKALILLPAVYLLSLKDRQSASKVNVLLHKIFLNLFVSHFILQLAFYVLHKHFHYLLNLLVGIL
jgi:hypothetical protein